MTQGGTPALHAEAQALLDQIREGNVPPYEAMSAAEARAVSAGFTGIVGFPSVEVGSVCDLDLGVSLGAPLPGRLYQPHGVGSAPAEPTGAVLFVHGGGWVVGDLESHDTICRELCRQLDCPVLSVHYRLAPEHRFPAAAEDTFTALRWLHDQAAMLGIDAARIAVCGDSAGGNLAAVAAIAARDGIVPPVAFQALVYPVTDLAGESAGYARIAAGMPVTGPTMRWFRHHYLGPDGDAHDWRASPLRASSLADVAPALVVTVGHDPLCEEGRAYARRLVEEGVEVTEVHFAQHLHGLISMGALMRDARFLLDIVISALRAAIGARAPLPRNAEQGA